MIKLYSFFNSSTSYRVRIALELKDIEYQYHAVNIRVGQECSEEYRLINPSKAVPVLIDNEVEISQSMAILQYLDDHYPEFRLIPRDPTEKIRSLEISNNIACDMHPVNNLRILAYLKNTLGISDEQKFNWYQHWIEQGFDAVEMQLERYSHGSYCFGDSPGLADCCLVPQVANALRMGCELKAYSRIMSIYDQCLQLPAFQRAAPEHQPDFVA